MKLSISNIAWPARHDEEMYAFLRDHCVDGLEIAPTRIFPPHPYENISAAKDFAQRIKEKYGLAISSIQSIWYGIPENIFTSYADRNKLTDYTQKAVDFACALNSGNLVFGCPKNRCVPDGMPPDIYWPVICGFLTQTGTYAASKGTCIAIEANPPIYNTNFINTTAQAFALCRKLDNPGIKVNLDIGAVICNKETISIDKDNIGLINHIHLSEPRLAPIRVRPLHGELINMLRDLSYHGYLSVEMADANDIDLVKQTLLYVKDLFHDV